MHAPRPQQGHSTPSPALTGEGFFFGAYLFTYTLDRLAEGRWYQNAWSEGIR